MNLEINPLNIFLLVLAIVYFILWRDPRFWAYLSRMNLKFNLFNIFVAVVLVVYIILWTNPQYWAYREKRQQDRIQMLKSVFGDS